MERLPAAHQQESPPGGLSQPFTFAWSHAPWGSQNFRSPLSGRFDWLGVGYTALELPLNRIKIKVQNLEVNVLTL